MAEGEVKRPPKVSKALQNAIHDDFLKQAQNDAKFRAVAQFADYDTFKNMVAAAHLRPINDGKKATSEGPSRGWVLGPDGSRIEVGEAARAATGIEASVSTTLQRPANAAEFQRDWRRHCKTVQDKMAYLDLCGVENISSIFKVEINGPLLSEILVALAEFGRSSPEHGSAALGYMEALAQGGRFSLNVKLISRAAKDAVRGLMESVPDDAKEGVGARVAALRDLYGV